MRTPAILFVAALFGCSSVQTGDAPLEEPLFGDTLPSLSGVQVDDDENTLFIGDPLTAPELPQEPELEPSSALPDPIDDVVLEDAPLAGERLDEPASFRFDDASEDHGSDKRLSFFAGARSFGDDAVWEPVETGVTLGVEYSQVGRRNGLGFETGLLGSLGVNDSIMGDENVIGVAAELYAGMRAEFKAGRVRPYIGAGGTFLFADVNNDSGSGVADGQNSSLGFYIHGGALVPTSTSSYVGIDLRYVGGTDLDAGPVSGDADYSQALFVIGVEL